MNVGMLLEMAAEAGADRLALGKRPQGYTTRSLLRAARWVSEYIRNSGAHYVALVDVNSEALPIAFIGAALAGVPFVPVNYRLTDGQLAAVLSRIVPGIAIVGGDMASRVAGVDGLVVWEREELLASVDGHLLRRSDPDVTSEGVSPWVDPDDLAVLLFTSGTTGAPKAAVLRHRHLASYIIGSVSFMAAGEDEAQLVSVPPYHIAGVSSVLSSIYSGRRLVYLPSFDARAWIQAVETEKITHAMVVPTMLDRIIKAAEQEGRDLSSLRHLSYGGGRMPVETIEDALKAFPNVDFVNAYGLTETSSTISVLGPDDHRVAMSSSDPVVRARLVSVGRPLPTIEVRISDENGVEVPVGQRGEVWVRGEQVSGEYVGHSSVDSKGWLHTRDAGCLDPEGFLFLDGRLDDVIVRGGENLSPGEIESTLEAHPAVSRAAVVGIPDSEWGESVAAAVVLEAEASVNSYDLQQWIRERLRSTKVPVVIEFHKELPYSETGKLLRRVIRDEMRSRCPN